MWRYILIAAALVVETCFNVIAILCGHSMGWLVGMAVVTAAAIGSMALAAFAPRH